MIEILSVPCSLSMSASKASAQRLAPLHPDCYFLLADGVSYHGYAVSGGRKTGGGPLADPAMAFRVLASRSPKAAACKRQAMR